MIDQIKEGELPSAEGLSTLLKVALVKKQGVLQQPPASWNSDPKINTDADHLLWAAILLGQEEEILAAAGRFISELTGRPGKIEPGGEYDRLYEKLGELEKLAPQPEFGELLKKMINRTRKIISAGPS